MSRRDPYLDAGAFLRAFAPPAPRSDPPLFSRPRARHDPMPPPLISQAGNATRRTDFVPPLAMEGRLNQPPVDREYPIDLDGALDYMREPLSVNAEPWPSMIGAVNGLFPFQDALSKKFAIARGNSGPWSGVGQARPVTRAFEQDIFPDLLKVDG